MNAMEVFPTPVGMNRLTMQAKIDSLGVPHARGDEPCKFTSFVVNEPCSPRPWG